jgi:hypothetical protein
MFVDWINGSFEIVGGILSWMNVKKLQKDKHLAGVYWPVTAFFSVWGLWNLFYYPSLDQWVSFVGGLFLVSGNSVWVLLAIKYQK